MSDRLDEARRSEGLELAGWILPLLGLVVFVLSFLVDGRPHCQTSIGDHHGPDPTLIWFVPALFLAAIVARLLVARRRPRRGRWRSLPGIVIVLVVGALATLIGLALLDLATC